MRQGLSKQSNASFESGDSISFVLWLTTFALAGLFLFAICREGFAQNRQIDEYQLKAGFMFNFARFVEWPAQDSSLPLHFCVVDDATVSKQIENILSGKTIGSRPLQIVRISHSSDGRDCEIVFFPGTSMTKARSMLKDSIRPGTLTVGENPTFLQSGGIINFVTENDRVRFQINAAAADQNKVKLSSRLLALGRIVGRQEQ